MRNKSLLMTIAISLIAMSSFAQVKGTFTDSRDGKIYITVKIGTQTWMAENLAYEARRGCWAYDNNATNVAKYGYLYDWETAKTVCPTGWHLPTDDEWTTLTTYLGGEAFSGEKMKSTRGWFENGNGTNTSGFSALPGGYRSKYDTFDNVGSYGYWWSSTESYAATAWNWYICCKYSYVDRFSYNKSLGHSVRCIRDF